MVAVAWVGIGDDEEGKDWIDGGSYKGVEDGVGEGEGRVASVDWSVGKVPIRILPRRWGGFSRCKKSLLRTSCHRRRYI